MKLFVGMTGKRTEFDIKERRVDYNGWKTEYMRQGRRLFFFLIKTTAGTILPLHIYQLTCN